MWLDSKADNVQVRVTLGVRLAARFVYEFLADRAIFWSEDESY